MCHFLVFVSTSIKTDCSNLFQHCHKIGSCDMRQLPQDLVQMSVSQGNMPCSSYLKSIFFLSPIQGPPIFLFFYIEICVSSFLSVVLKTDSIFNKNISCKDIHIYQIEASCGQYILFPCHFLFLSTALFPSIWTVSGTWSTQ